ncbi:SusC/RagA family TonB-linked outer membrane protein [Flavihumibacter sp. R14]|nr:SusC/RagA family TonB-linked outer membrane protein [Flavihumibacter soli]
MKKRITLLIFLFAIFISTLALAQPREVSGKVTANEDGAPLTGVSVLIRGTQTGATTDQNGNYRITVPDQNSVLVFRYLGYGSREISVGSQSVLNVTLVADNTQLSEVVVTALGISKDAKVIGYSAQSVGSEELNRNRQSNVVNALQGKIAGVTISSTGGAPGQGASIQIRGVNSIDVGRDNQPLFVIDGVMFDNTTSTFGQSADLRGMSNRAADINPDDVESINVLKGGAATALYGLRGANGVVVITTKSGKSGALKVTFTSTLGTESVNKFPEIQDQYTIGYSGVYNPEDFFPSWGPTVAEAKLIDPTHPDKLYNHFEDAYESGWQARNSVTFSGGTDKVTFSSSLSHLKQEGVLPFTDYRNISARVNTDANISSTFRVGASLNFINSGGDRYNADRFNESLSYWSPRYDVRDYLTPEGTMKSYGNDNPIYGAYSNKLKDNVNRLVGGFNLNFKPLDWLDLSYRVGLDTYGDARTRTGPGPTGIEGERVYEDNGPGFVYEYNSNFRAVTSTFIATANTKLAENLNATFRAGQDLYDRKIKEVGVEGDTLTVYDWFDLRNAKQIVPKQNIQDYRLMGIFGEVTLDYKNFLFLTLTGRNDITSSLKSGNNSFFYPSASLSYLFSDHFTLPEKINYGKFRASYAKIGKDALPYSTSTGYSSYQLLPPGSTGFSRSPLLGDPNLRPEFTETYEGGLEMGFFDNRLSFNGSYYYSLSKDQIINVQVSSTTGFVTAAVNAGEMRNKGVELVLTGVPVRNNNFRWDVNLNFSANKNKILSIREDLTEISYASQFGYSGSAVTMKLVPGQPYGNIYGTYFARYYGGAAEDPLMVDESKPIIIGANGFPVRQPVANQKILGNSQPDWIGGITNTFRYKDFSLSALVDARVGQERYNQMGNFFSAFGIAEYTEDRNETRVFEGVLADGSPNTKAVWLGQGIGPDGVNYTNGYYRNVHRTASENFIEDASWVRLRSVSLGYSLPPKFLQNSFIKNATLTATGNNLWLGTDYTGYDPETSSTPSGSNVDGFTGFTYPAVRSFLLTLNVGF